MHKAVKLSQLMNVAQVDEEVSIPLPGGGKLIIARPGDWCLYQEDEENGGRTFVRVVNDKEWRDKWYQV